MPSTQGQNSGPDAARSTITADDLPPHLRARVKTLIHDLANDDLPMALLDLAHLYRALASAPGRRGEDATMGLPSTNERFATLIYTHDQSAIEDVCDGPDDVGRCPRAEVGDAAACAGRWIMAKGWNFKVAADAGACPLVALGMVRRYLEHALPQTAE